MTSTQRSQQILAYWTPGRLAAAQPEEHAYGEHIEMREDAVVEGCYENEDPRKRRPKT